MRSKKTYREYRESESVKFPTAAWLLDQVGIYAIVLLVALFAIGSFMKMGWDSYTAAIKPPEVVTPYADIVPASFVGKTWAEKLIAMNPADLPSWTVDKSAKPRPIIDPKNCSADTAAPVSLLSTHVATSNGTDIRVQVYGAGQAAKQFEDYLTAFGPCFGSMNAENSGKTIFTVFPRGFILTSGDAIIGAYTVNDQVRDVLLDFYLKNVESSLIESGCLALNTSATDATRNIFFSKDKYTGLKGSTNLESSVDTANLPTPTGLKLTEVEDPSVVAPEGPLPDTFPTLPKVAVQKPQVPAALKTEGSFKSSATYQIVDDKGPGCGWEWTAQVSPELDLKKLEKERNNAILKAQGSLDGSATTYVSGKINWALQLAALAPNIDSWNTFANQTNTVHKKWQWLETERSKIESAWRQYVVDHDEWLTFDQRKSDALKKFDEEFKKCQKDEKDLADWNRDWKDIAEKQAKDKAKSEADAKDAEKNKPTASPTPTPSATSSEPAVTVPPKPAGCSTPPTEPEIATQTKPEEPKATVLPKDVTIPASWPTPKTN